MFDNKAYHKAYYQANKAHLDAKNKEASKSSAYLLWKKTWSKDYSRRYIEANRGKFNAKASKRHAAKKQRTPKWLTSLHYQQIEVFYAASVSLSKEFGFPLNVDHIVPLQGKYVSGLHVPWNLQVIPESENNSKRNTFKLEK